jgi:Reverse transcriptase (RNA-dependent DNA polymerase)
MAGAEFLVKADISACFPSIYTHSIPWAIHGREVAKKKQGLLDLSGNLIDKCTRNTRDKQTNGLLIGPHASNVISEIILTSVDCTLQGKGYKRLKRYIDDYEFYATSYDEAQRFLKDLGLGLREYELTINERKTHILPLPRPSVENWVRELNRFSFPKDEEVYFSTVQSFLDLALELAQAAGTSSPLNYAIKMLADNRDEKPLNLRAKRLYVQEAINLALMYPYLAPFLDKYVFDKFWYEGIREKIADFSASLVRLGMRKLYPDTIAHAIYYALKHEVAIPLKEDDLLEVLTLDDCLASVLLLEYAANHDMKKIQKALKMRAAKLKTGDPRDRDKHWLLIYQTWTEKELNGNKQTFLAKLKKQGFKFLVIPSPKAVNPEAKVSDIPDSNL